MADLVPQRLIFFSVPFAGMTGRLYAGRSNDCVGTAAPGCPAERSSAGPVSLSEEWRASLAGTAEGGCPHVTCRSYTRSSTFDERGAAFPGSLESLLHEGRVVIALLRFQGLLQSEQRTRVTRMMLQIGAEDFLRSRSIAAHQQCRAQRLAHREEPVFRLVVLERILHRHRAFQQGDGGGAVFARAIFAPNTSRAIFNTSLVLLFTGMAKIASSGVFFSAPATTS